LGGFPIGFFGEGWESGEAEMKNSVTELLDEYLTDSIMKRYTARLTETMVYQNSKGLLISTILLEGLNEDVLESEIDKARNGDGLAFDSLLETAAQILSFSQPLYPDLGFFVADFLMGRTKRPARPKPSDAGNFFRNGMIYSAVEKLKSEHQMTYTLAYDTVANYLRTRGRDPSNAKSIKAIHLKNRELYSGIAGTPNVDLECLFGIWGHDEE
jgi:hypothetical protein